MSRAGSALRSVIEAILNISDWSQAHWPLFRRSLISATAHEKGLELVLLLHSDVSGKIFAGGNRIDQVVIHVLNNAIKFTDSGYVVVEVSVAKVNGQQTFTRIEVSDTGIGLIDEEAESVFQPFRQAVTQAIANTAGRGLGL